MDNLNFESIKAIMDKVMEFITEFANKLRAFIEGLKGGKTEFDATELESLLG